MYFLSKSSAISPSTYWAFLSPADIWRPITWEAIALSALSSLISLTTKMVSNLDKIDDWKSICSAACFKSSYLPMRGLAAARTDALEFRIVVIPAFAIEIVCYSIASWIATLSYCLILSNSSMQTIPPSARTIAPPSSWKSPEGSLMTEAVRPAAEEPFPLV